MLVDTVDSGIDHRIILCVLDLIKNPLLSTKSRKKIYAFGIIDGITIKYLNVILYIAFEHLLCRLNYRDAA